MANEFKVKNGIKFPDGTVQITAASGTGSSGTVYIGSSPPVGPTAGYLWWDSNSGSLKVYYNDGTSSQWVDAFNGGLGIVYVDSGGGGSGTVETPSAATFTYDSSGYVTQMVETFSGGNKTTTYSYNPDNSINTETSVYLGVTKTTTYYYTDGRLTSYTVT